MKEDEKKKILKNYYEDFLPIDLVKDIYKEKLPSSLMPLRLPQRIQPLRQAPPQ
mgnify:CR=1 FL=1